MKNLRTKGKSTIVWLLMGLLILGLGGFGVTSFSGGSSAIGSVGGTKVTADEYTRALQTEINSYARQSGQQFSMQQAQAIGLPQAIQARLFTAAALEEETRQIGVSVGDAQVADVIANAAAFQGPNGKFDRTTYGQILRREGLSEAEFEEEIRVGEAQQILQRAVINGVAAPKAVIDQSAKWGLERRDFSYDEITEDQLAVEASEPDEETLKAWHQANADRFTAPETRKITYIWLTPEMLAKDVELNEEALRDAYEQRIDEYQQPERRLVSRLVFPSAEEAEAAKKRLDAGELSFAELVQERGLTLDDIDLGEAAKADLGAAGDAVFGLDQPGVTGPVETRFGPALYSMNAILEPVDVSFEEAKEELRGEAALERAARTIQDRIGEFEDLLVSGASLEDAAKETEMELGTIEWNENMEPEGGSIGGYPAFRAKVAEVTENDFPEIETLDDGGVFALRLDEIVAPALKPFEDIREEVVQDWRDAEVQRLLLALADEMQVKIASKDVPVTEVEAGESQQGATPNSTQQTETETSEATTAEATAVDTSNVQLSWVEEKDVARDGWIDGMPQQLISRAFDVEKVGGIEVVDTGSQVFLVRLDGIHEADLSGEDAQAAVDSAGQRMTQSMQADLFDYYARAIQNRSGVKLDQSVVEGINARIP